MVILLDNRSVILENNRIIFRDNHIIKNTMVENNVSWRLRDIILISIDGKHITNCSPRVTTELLRRKIVRVISVNPFTIQMNFHYENHINDMEVILKIKDDNKEAKKIKQQEQLKKKMEWEKFIGKKLINKSAIRKKSVTNYNSNINLGVIRKKRHEKNRHVILSKNQRLRASGTLSGDDVLSIGESQDWRCYYCMCDIRHTYSLDHYHPVILGGLTNKDNIVLSCKSCNSRKHSTPPLKYYNIVLKKGIKGYIYENSWFFKRIRAKMESVEK